MRPLEAYQRQKQASMYRIDLILALYRKALELLQRARQARRENHPDAADRDIGTVRLIVTSLASGQAGAANEAAANFLRLYEFVSHRLTLGTVDDIDAAEKVLRNLFEAFAAVRDQAAALEMQGQLPPLDREQMVHLSA